MQNNNNHANHFIQRLSEDEAFRLEIGHALVNVKEGDWAEIVRIAEASGFHFSQAELLAAVPERFFKGKGKNPDAGWDEKTRIIKEVR